MENLSWTCPYCNRPTTITNEDQSEELHIIHLPTKQQDLCIRTQLILCPNPECKEFTVIAELGTTVFDAGYYMKRVIFHWNLKPNSNAKPLPDYIPEPIRKDYEESCQIVELSPKASATISRRCLQGMIRDYWKISKNRLIDEINELKGSVDLVTWKAIDSVRSIGNIGAHMEKDVNLIIDVDQNEAKLLIGLIELLLKDWYIARKERENLLQGIIEISEEKAIKKSEKSE